MKPNKYDFFRLNLTFESKCIYLKLLIRLFLSFSKGPTFKVIHENLRRCRLNQFGKFE